MNWTKMILAGAVLAATPTMTLAQQSGPLPSAAQQAPTKQSPSGMVTTIDRINNTIVIRQTQNGTVGAGNGGATDQQFSATANLLEKIHAGDKVSYTASDNGGKKTITKIDLE
jgi:Cu/Ag efflux protein CusF